MYQPGRDLLVLLKQETMTPQAMEYQIDWLHEILQQVESIESLISAHEIININQYKISNNIRKLQAVLSTNTQQPFVFLNCKN
ncbi:MAG: hypothetical protein ACOYLO_12170 [Ferruginibacter sp.]